MAETDYFKREKDEISKDQTKLAEIERKLDLAYQRWEELDG